MNSNERNIEYVELDLCQHINRIERLLLVNKSVK